MFLKQGYAKNGFKKIIFRVVKLANRILGRRTAVFHKHDEAGHCMFIGKAAALPLDLLHGLQAVSKFGAGLKQEQIYIFGAALVENGTRVRTSGHNVGCARNESLVIDVHGNVVELLFIFAVVNKDFGAVAESFVKVRRLPKILGTEMGTTTIPVNHIFSVSCNGRETDFLPTCVIEKQLVILKSDNSGGLVTVSLPSNIFCIT